MRRSQCHLCHLSVIGYQSPNSPISDIDGGWSSWRSTFDEKLNCTKRERKCNKPIPCGDGSTCEGIRIEGSCPGMYIKMVKDCHACQLSPMAIKMFVLKVK